VAAFSARVAFAFVTCGASGVILVAKYFQATAAVRTDAVVAFVQRAGAFVTLVTTAAYQFQTSAAVQAPAVRTVADRRTYACVAFAVFAFVAPELKASAAIYALPVPALAHGLARALFCSTTYSVITQRFKTSAAL